MLVVLIRCVIPLSWVGLEKKIGPRAVEKDGSASLSVFEGVWVCMGLGGGVEGV